MTSSSVREGDLDEVLIEEVQKLTRPEPVDPLPPETSEDIAALATRLEAVEASIRSLRDELHDLHGIARNLKRSCRHYTLLRR